MEYYLAFSHHLGIGPLRFDQLLKNFKGVKEAYEAPINHLKKILGSKTAEKFTEFRAKFKSQEKLRECRDKGIIVLTREDERFPSQLLNLSDAPICLYVKGDLNNFDFDRDLMLAIVGTRRATPYGLQIAKKFSSELSSSGLVIVSGMAMGIDTAAHQAALNAHGRTIAILGCGVDIIYPPSNHKLYESIIASGGLIISEFPPGMQGPRGLFISRNRLISGLSRGVLVVEGLADSGALATARFAAEQGRDVFAPPGPLTSEMSAAPHILIREGAKLVTTTNDIFEEFNLKVTPSREREIELTDDERMIFNIIKTEPKFMDEIIAELQIDVNKILNLTSILEIKGIIEKNTEGRYQACL